MKMPDDQVTASELLEVVRALPARAPATMRTSGRTDLKRAWLGRLSETDGAAPSINGRLLVPAPLPSQRLVMPEAWLANAHRAAETP